MADRRRRCALESCRRQYRPKLSTSIYCTTRCRVAAHRKGRSGQKTERNGNGPRYVELLGQPQKPPEPSRDEQPSDEEYMAALVATMLPDGMPSGRPSPAPAPPQDGPPAHITIRNVPTRFPGTPPNRGRQLTP